MWWAYDPEGELKALPPGPLLLPALMISAVAFIFSSVFKDEQSLESFAAAATSPRYKRDLDRYLVLASKSADAEQTLSDSEFYELRALTQRVYNDQNRFIP